MPYSKATLGLSMLLGALGCSEDGPLPESVLIGPSGGTIEAGAARVVIPPNALAVETALGLATSSGAISPPEGYDWAGPVYAFTPHGTTFAKPVTITIPYGGEARGLAVLRLPRENEGEWATIFGARFDRGEATFESLSFSLYGVGRPLRDEPDGGVAPDAATLDDAGDATTPDDAGDAATLDDAGDAATRDDGGFDASGDAGPSDALDLDAEVQDVPDAGPGDAGTCFCPEAPSVVAQWASGPNDLWVIANTPVAGTSHGVYHYDGVAWAEPADWIPPPFGVSLTLPYEPTMRLIAGRVTGAGRSEVRIEGTDALGVASWDGAALTAEWINPISSQGECWEPADHLWISGDNQVVAHSGTGHNSATGLLDQCFDVSLPIFPTMILSSTIASTTDYRVDDCEAEIDTNVNFGSWDPDRVAVGVSHTGACNALVHDCRVDPEPPCPVSTLPLTYQSRVVYARQGTSGAVWTPLNDADLIGVPCGSSRPFAFTNGGDLYAYTSTSESWDLSNSFWPIVSSSPICENSWPVQPLPACACP